MNETLLMNCQECQAALTEDQVQGLCPQCLLKTAMTPGDDPALREFEQLTSLFEDYDIDDKIGEGGMGSVYQATQRQLGRVEALKVLHSHITDDPSFEERFQREARTLAALNHNHIVTLYSSGRRGDKAYLAMEYVKGQNLRQTLSATPAESQRLRSILGQVVSALKYSHEQGIIHRDLKPENILLDQAGQVKLADFGLARLVDDRKSLSPSLTGTRQVMGTPNYMAPEQLDGRDDLTQAVDLYALGVLCYEALTGQLPRGRFKDPSVIARSGLEALAHDLEPVLLKALATDPAERTVSLEDFEQALEGLSGEGLTTSTTKASRSVSLALTGLVVFLLSFVTCIQATGREIWATNPDKDDIPAWLMERAASKTLNKVHKYPAFQLQVWLGGVPIPTVLIPLSALIWGLLGLFAKGRRRTEFGAASVAVFLIVAGWIGVHHESVPFRPVPWVFLLGFLASLTALVVSARRLSSNIA